MTVPHTRCCCSRLSSEGAARPSSGCADPRTARRGSTKQHDRPSAPSRTKQCARQHLACEVNGNTRWRRATCTRARRAELHPRARSATPSAHPGARASGFGLQRLTRLVATCVR
eukprot:6774947-Alexandrium_andersonii.AAC.1